ncbi:MAG: transposase [bacterium]
MKRSIYPERSQEASSILFDGDSRKTLVVPLDFAKREHAALVCLGTGEALSRPLRVFNTMEGVRFLVGKIERERNRLQIDRGRVLVGGEDPAAYAINFLEALRAERYMLLRVGAKEAKKYRSSTRASSDQIDMTGIAEAIIHHRARNLERHDGLWHKMRCASRARGRLVCDETALKNRIHRLVETLFPGFLDAARPPVAPFSDACLAILEKDFTIHKFRRTREATLAQRLASLGVHKPSEAATGLKALAENAIAPVEGEVAEYQARSLASKVESMRALRKSLWFEENEMARCLVQTPGFWLTTIPGVGVTLAGNVCAELGPTERWPDADHMASYAGIVSRQKQTGGQDSPPRKGGLPPDTNRRLRNYLLQVARHCGTTADPAGRLQWDLAEHVLMKKHKRIEAKGGRSRLATAKKFLDVARSLVRAGAYYMPERWLGSGFERVHEEEYHGYLAVMNDTLERKWREYDLAGIEPEVDYLVQWRILYECVAEHRSHRTRGS